MPPSSLERARLRPWLGNRRRCSSPHWRASCSVRPSRSACAAGTGRTSRGQRAAPRWSFAPPGCCGASSTPPTRWGSPARTSAGSSMSRVTSTPHSVSLTRWPRGRSCDWTGGPWRSCSFPLARVGALGATASATLRGGTPGGPTPLAASGPSGDQPPLRRGQRLLRAAARTLARLQLRLLRRRLGDSGGRASSQAGSRVPQAWPAAGDAAARRRLRVGILRTARSLPLRRACRGRDDLLGPGRAGAATGE
jgi:hypothetical protein